MSRKIIVTLGEDKRPIGEHHHRAKLSDEDVEFIRDIYDEGFASYSTLAKVFNVHKATIADIVNFRKRASAPASYKTIDAQGRKPLPKSRLKQLGIEDFTQDELEDWDGGH